MANILAVFLRPQKSCTAAPTSRLTAQSTKAIFPRLRRSSRHLADVQPPERWHALVFRAPQSAHVDPKRAPVRTLNRQAIPICTPYLAASAKIAAGGENGSIRPRTSDTPSLLDGNFGKAEKFWARVQLPRQPGQCGSARGSKSFIGG